jgi:hypothetical protein
MSGQMRNRGDDPKRWSLAADLPRERGERLRHHAADEEPSESLRGHIRTWKLVPLPGLEPGHPV